MSGGQEATTEAGSVIPSMSVRLRSRKTAGGASAERALTGQGASFAQGVLTPPATPVWTSVPSLVYTEGVSTQTSPINLGSYVSGYNALTDVFQLVGGPTWLILSGNLLYANGTQVNADDTTVNIGVSRSGGAYVYTGTLTVTVNAAQATNDTWTRLDNGSGGPGSTGSVNFFYTSAVRQTTGEIWAEWAKDYFWNPATGNWTTGSVTFGNRENSDACYDSTRDSLWIGSGTSGSPQSPATLGAMEYSWGGTYTNVNATKSSGAGCGMAWHDDFLYKFGGFTTDASNLARAATPTGSYTALNPTGGASVVLDNDCVQYTMYRSGCDSRTGQIWLLNSDQDFCVWNPGTNRWSVVPTFGTKPPASHPSNNHGGVVSCLVAELHEAANSIVAFVGENAMVVGAPNRTVVRKTYVLDLGTMVWRLGPAGASAPPAVVVSYMTIMYDSLNSRILLTVADQTNTTTQVWSFVPEGPSL